MIGADGLRQAGRRRSRSTGGRWSTTARSPSLVVVYDLPVTFDLDAAMAGRRASRTAGTTIAPPASASSRSAAPAPTCAGSRSRPCYVFHPLNAHDDGDQVVLDVVRYDRMFDAKRLGPDDAAPLLWRWTIDTGAGTVHEEQLGDQPVEFPRVDERLVGRRPPLGLRLGDPPRRDRQRLRRATSCASTARAAT